MRRLPLISLVSILAASCVVERRTTTFPRPEVSVRAVETIERWAVELDGRRVGLLSHLEIQDPSQPERVYMVQRPSGQIAGWIDSHGRAFQPTPFPERQLVLRQSGEVGGSPFEAVYSIRRDRVLVAMDSIEEDLRVLLELATQPRLRRLDGLLQKAH